MMNAKIEPQALMPFLSDRYGMSSDVTCSFIRRGGNDHYVVEDGVRKYVLRLYLNGKYFIRSADDFRFELDLIQFLVEQDLPVAAPMPDVDDQRLVRFESDGETRLAVLFEFAEGQGHLGDDGRGACARAREHCCGTSPGHGPLQ